MKFGVREICDVVLRAKDKVKIGNQVFEKDEPVIYFDTAKTSTVEGAATTVYATGGKGNSRLIAWEGERTVTFTMEDALLSPLGFAILSGAGIVEAGASSAAINVHSTTTTIGTVSSDSITINLNDVLPTNGTAKFFSPLSVDDFIKKSSIISYSREALEKIHTNIEQFAECEKLTAHANSIKVRFENN